MAYRAPVAYVSRRHLLLGTAATAASALIAACGGNSSATDTPKPAAPTVAPTATTGITPSPTVAPVATVTQTTAPIATATAAPAATATTAPAAIASPIATAPIAVATVGTTLATSAAATVPLIIFAGSSLTIGFGAPPTDNYPTQTIALLAPAKYDAVNLGVNGRPTNTMISLASKNIDPLYATGRSKNIVVMWEGQNDLVQGASAEEAYANIVKFCQGRRSVGFKVVVLTLLPRTSYVREGTDFEADRGVINTSIRKNLASFADALADVGADPTIGTAGAQANSEYYQPDGTHLIRKGNSIVAKIVAAAILTL